VWPGLLISLPSTIQGVPRPSRGLRRAGLGNAGVSGVIPQHVVTNQLAQAASPPTPSASSGQALAKSARMGHPQRKWWTQASLNVAQFYF